MAVLRALPHQALDLEDATHRLTLDLIMQWSYSVDFKGVASFGADAEKVGNGTRDAAGTPFTWLEVTFVNGCLRASSQMHCITVT